MRRLLFVIFLVLIGFCSTAGAADPLPQPVAEFLATRTLLVTVPFAPGSATLTVAAEQLLEQHLDQLRQVDPAKYLLRVEGFTSPEGGAELNVNLAMERAKQVELYLLRQADLPNNRSLTGIGVESGSRLKPELQRRVEIVRYDNTLQFDKLPIEKLTQQ